ncbi:MAG: dihydroorotate dehydrogenase electron transfer subunit [Lachnospiraceae bacterium]|nr:dihydroorotate dehydrogenase electron transfer subunit [Lachnospiraceae bacterium]
MKKQKSCCRVLFQEQIAAGIFDLRLETALGSGARPGQFVGVFPKDGAMLLPRPVSICDADDTSLRLVYRIAGKGTASMSALRPGDSVDVLGVLGNGFPLEEAAGKQVLLMGGGIGIPPMLFAARVLSERIAAGHADAPAAVTIVCGYRDAETFLSEELSACGNLLIATDDGSAGTQGTVIDALRAAEVKADVIFACGPKPMLSAVKEYGASARTFLSLEERMACGVGACLGCVCKTTETDAHSHVRNARVCTDGPVFAGEEVSL